MLLLLMVKDFLEGSRIKCAVPKNKGGNILFKGAALVFHTAPDEVKLKRYGKEVASETPQMRKRLKYIHLSHEIPEGERKEVAKVCSQCSARLYLEGKALLDNRQAQPSPIEAGALPGAIGS